MIALLACPFCGGPPKVVWFNFGLACEIECADRQCGAEGPPKDTEEEAVEAWNKRA